MKSTVNKFDLIDPQRILFPTVTGITFFSNTYETYTKKHDASKKLHFCLHAVCPYLPRRVAEKFHLLQVAKYPTEIE